MARGVAGSIQRFMHFFLPKEEDFFVVFEAMSRHAVEAAKILASTLAGELNALEAVEPVGAIEEAVDDLRHESVRRLNETFVTPIMFDRADIMDLTQALDEVVDQTRAATDRLALFRPRTIPPGAVRLGELLVQATEAMHDLCGTILHLREAKAPQIAAINAIENEADRVVKQALANLFSTETDAVEVIKWKELYDHLEEAVDCCEDVASSIEGALVKNS